MDHHDASRALWPLDAETEMSYQGRDAVVLGLGQTGLSLARYLTRHRARVRVADTRASPPNAAALAATLPGVRLETGPFSASTFDGADLIAISPGVPKDQPSIRAAVDAGAELVGDVELFARALPPAQKVLAITGTNGKTTVTALDRRAHAGGRTRDRRGWQHRRRGARHASTLRERRAVAGRLRARAVELPARDDGELRRRSPPRC